MQRLKVISSFRSCITGYSVVLSWQCMHLHCWFHCLLFDTEVQCNECRVSMVDDTEISASNTGFLPRKLCSRKDNCEMRLIYECSERFCMCTEIWNTPEEDLFRSKATVYGHFFMLLLLFNDLLDVCALVFWRLCALDLMFLDDFIRITDFILLEFYIISALYVYRSLTRRYWIFTSKIA